MSCRGDLRDEFGCERIGLTGGGAIADGDQFHPVPGDESGERRLGLIPLIPGLMWEDRPGVDDLARSVDDGHLYTGTEAGVKTESRTSTGRRGEQQILEIARKHIDSVVLGSLAQLHTGVDRCRDHELGPPGPPHSLRQPRSGRAAGGEVHAERIGDHHLIFGVLTTVEGHRQDLLLLPAQHGQHPVRGRLGERFGELEVVSELLCGSTFGDVFGTRRGAERTLAPELGAHRTHQFGILGGTFDDDVPSPFERSGRIGHRLPHVSGGNLGGVDRRVGEQGVGERFEACLTGDLRLGAPLGLVRQIDVLESGLGVCCVERGGQLRGELALFGDRGEDRVAAGIEFTQVGEAFVEGTQLGVVEAAGHLLAVPRDERDGRTLVEHRDGRDDLMLADLQFLGDTGGDGFDTWHCGSRQGGRTVVCGARSHPRHTTGEHLQEPDRRHRPAGLTGRR